MKPINSEIKTAIKVLIIDDEFEACYNLKNIIETYFEYHQLEIVGVCQTTQEAEQLIYELKPDALFIDIEMHHENAFAFLERITPFNFELIFVTAFDDYAIKAFKLNAVDYILKPISIDELGHAIEKLKLKIQTNNLVKANGDFKELSRDFNLRKLPESIKLRTLGRLDIIPFQDILFVEGKGAYSIFHYRENGDFKEILVSHSISEYEQILPETQFFRIHKSYLVNLKYIKKIMREPGNEIVLYNDIRLSVGRRKIGLLQDFLDKNL